MTKEILLIGGKSNGARILIDTQDGMPICVMHQPGNVRAYLEDPGEFFPILVGTINETYMTRRIPGSNVFIGVYSTLTLEKALELLVKRHPKKRKKSAYPTWHPTAGIPKVKEPKALATF